VRNALAAPLRPLVVTNIYNDAVYSAFCLTVALRNCMVKRIPPVNFCSDENMYSNYFWNKVGRFFKLLDRLQFNILNCRKSCEKNNF
jgi:hypothetical protein